MLENVHIRCEYVTVMRVNECREGALMTNAHCIVIDCNVAIYTCIIYVRCLLISIMFTCSRYRRMINYKLEVSKVWCISGVPQTLDPSASCKMAADHAFILKKVTAYVNSVNKPCCDLACRGAQSSQGIASALGAGSREGRV